MFRDRRSGQGRDDEHHLVAIALANWPTENDKAFGDERVHEVRMFVPAGLRASGQRVTPGRALSEADEERVCQANSV